MFINTKWAVYLSERSADNTIGIHVADRFSEEDNQRFHSIIEGAVQQFENVNLLIAFENGANRDPESAWRDIHFAFGNVENIDQIALVGNAELLDWLEDTIDADIPAEVRFFKPHEYDIAWDWLN
jgi:hypothetical protein